MSASSEDKGSLSERYDLRNAAIVAHVDHGKTALVDAMLWQSGAFGERATAEKTGERVMDPGDLEREKGITILAKNTAVRYTGLSAVKFDAPEDVTISVIDTPGHVDFGGEIERGLSMVDDIVLLVDASKGPLPQTRFVLCKALGAKLPIITVVNKVDHPDVRINEVISETQDLLFSLYSDLDGPDDAILDRPLEVPAIFYATEVGYADTLRPEDGELPANRNLGPLFEAMPHYIPAPEYDADAGLVAQVANLDASPFLGRLALTRIYSGELTKDAWVGFSGKDSALSRAHISELLATKGLNRKPTQIARTGDIVAVTGVEDITIGDCSVGLGGPHPLPPTHVDDPAISMTVGISDSPLTGKAEGRRLAVHQVRDRLKAEPVGNISIGVLSTDRPDQWKVQGRGGFALAILVEQMRRRGFELTVGKPWVITKAVDDKIHEPVERATTDAPEEYLDAVTQIMATHKGQVKTMPSHGSGWVWMESAVPTRDMVGFRSQFLTQARDTGITSSIGGGYAPWAGPVESRATGSLISDRQGQVTVYALQKLEDRGTFFVEPGQEVYEGQIVGKNPRDEDMDVNVIRAGEITNMRSATTEVFGMLQTPRKLTLEESIEFAADDECTEVTSEAMRIRRMILGAQERCKVAARAKRGKWLCVK